MSKSTILTSGSITHDATITVQLVETGGMQPMVTITWPEQPTVCRPSGYTDVAAVAMRLLANASTELARRKAARRR